MKSLLSSLLLFLAWAAPLSAQDMDASASSDATTPPNSTVITSDELRSDQVNHVSVFTGNVVVQGDNFNMKCQEMTVYFTKDSKVDHIVATGSPVVITQPDRITRSGHVEYFRDDDKFVLTDQPTILDHKNQIWAPTIIIYRTKQSMTTQGPTRTVLVQDNASSSSSPTPTPASPTNNQ
ncbi:MAG: hypothetical protein LV479_06805 [Methylacidiphilales bacterium]|nr:hypothetical protein [Candidatus Methylacidiphilales bacterium]